MSADIKLGTQYLEHNVVNIKVTGNRDNLVIQVQKEDFTENTVTVQLNKSTPVRIEVTGNIGTLNSNLKATVYGNVKQCNVGNVLEVEGFVQNFKSPRNSVTVDRNIKICHGTEWCARNGINRKQVRSKVIHINGDVIHLIVDIVNVEAEVVINGNVETAKVANVMGVKGNVINCEVGNIIKATMGKSKAKPIKQIRKENKDREEQFNRTFEELFSSIMT